MVARDGIEPPTPAFSGLLSTISPDMSIPESPPQPWGGGSDVTGVFTELIDPTRKASGSDLALAPCAARPGPNAAFQPSHPFRDIRAGGGFQYVRRVGTDPGVTPLANVGATASTSSALAMSPFAISALDSIASSPPAST
jgi:hypothetical protein